MSVIERNYLSSLGIILTGEFYFYRGGVVRKTVGRLLFGEHTFDVPKIICIGNFISKVIFHDEAKFTPSELYFAYHKIISHKLRCVNRRKRSKYRKISL